jgi:hypothetical protein
VPLEQSIDISAAPPALDDAAMKAVIDRILAAFRT